MAGLLSQDEVIQLVTPMRKYNSTRRLAALCLQNAEALPAAYIEQFMEQSCQQIRRVIWWVGWTRWRKLEQYLLDHHLIHHLETRRDIGATAQRADAYTNRAFAHYKLAHYRQAIADYERAIQLDAHNERAYTGRGIAHWRRDKETEASYASHNPLQPSA